MRASLLVAVASLALAQVPKPEKILVTRVFPQPGQIGLFLVAPDGSNEHPLVTPTDIDYDACSVGLHAIQIRGAVGRRHTSLVAGKKNRHTERHRVNLPVDANDDPDDGQTGMLINSTATDPRKED